MTEKATFDLETVEGQMKVFNAQSGASISIKTLDAGTELEVSDVLIHSDTTDAFGNGPQETEVTTLFTTDGNAYAGISSTIAKAAENLITFKEKTKLDVVKVKIIKQKSNSDREFFNIQISPAQ